MALPARTASYVQNAVLAEQVNIAAATEAARLTAVGKAASAAVDAYCQRRFDLVGSATGDPDGDGNGVGDDNLALVTQEIALPPGTWRGIDVSDIVAVTKVETRSSPSGDWSALTTASWVLPKTQGAYAPATRVWLEDEFRVAGSTFRSPYHNVRIEGQFGWPAVPDDVVEAATRQAVRLYARFRNPLGGGYESEQGGAQMYVKDPDVKMLLSKYRNCYIR